MTAQLAPAEPLAACQRMIVAADQHEPVVQQGQAEQIRVVLARDIDAELGLAREHRLLDAR